MITLIVAFALADPGLAPAQAMARKNLGQCLNRVVAGKVGDKLAADAFKAAARATCAAEENAFRVAWITYEMTMKTTHEDAEQNANAQIDDYIENAVETYQEMVKPR